MQDSNQADHFIYRWLDHELMIGPYKLSQSALLMPTAFSCTAMSGLGTPAFKCLLIANAIGTCLPEAVQLLAEMCSANEEQSLSLPPCQPLSGVVGDTSEVACANAASQPQASTRCVVNSKVHVT